MDKCRAKWNSIVGNNRSKPLLSKLPPQVSVFLGYRDPSRPKSSLIPDAPEWARLIQVLLLTYGALCVQAAINKYAYPFRNWNTSALIPSFGASAILCFNASTTPLAQPRNLFLGTLISAFIGIALAKLWLEDEANVRYLWLAAPLSCSISSVVMSVLKCIHPPAGAASVIPILQDEIRQLGWKYLVIELVGCSVFLAFACLFDNICARYPTHWWTPHPKPPVHPKIEIACDSLDASVDIDDAHILDLVSEIQEYLKMKSESY